MRAISYSKCGCSARYFLYRLVADTVHKHKNAVIARSKMYWSTRSVSCRSAKADNKGSVYSGQQYMGIMMVHKSIGMVEARETLVQPVLRLA